MRLSLKPYLIFKIFLCLNILLFSLACGGGTGGTDELTGGGITGTDSIIAGGGTAGTDATNATTQASGLTSIALASLSSSQSIEIKADIEAISTSANTLQLIGQSFLISSNTVFSDLSSSNIQNLNLSNLILGDHVQILASQTSDNVIKLNASSNVILKTKVESIQQPNFRMLQVQVQTNDSSTIYKDTSGNTVSSSSFFTSLTVGNSVQAVGTSAGNILTATEVQIFQ